MHRSPSASPLLAFLLLILFQSIAAAATWIVRSDGTGDAPTIQDAINLAANGDSVLLEAGTYTGLGNRDISYFGKDIVVSSVGGAAVTVIDCERLGRGFVFNNGEPPTAVLDGVTITSGSSSVGGAVHTSGPGFAKPTLRNNILVNNTAIDGGAIACSDQTGPTIESNQIIGNTATNNGAGVHVGVFSFGAVVRDNFIDGNSAGNHGGGIYSNNAADAAYVDNDISNNSASRGGGVYSQLSSADISGNSIHHNTPSGVEVFGSGVSANRIWENFGAGICLEGGGAMLNVIWGNTGVGVQTGTSVLSNNTIAANGSHGIAVASGSQPVIENSIMAFNQGWGISCTGNNPTVLCCNIFGNQQNLQFCNSLADNISVDPIFCGIPGDSAYFLAANSPCLPANNFCAVLIGALPAGCAGSLVPVTVECPGDTTILGLFGAPLLVLQGFRITNLESSSLSYFYQVTSSGLAALVDNGDPMSLLGVTPSLAPGASFTPPEAALDIPPVVSATSQSIVFAVQGLGQPVTDTCTTVVTFDQPVPVLISRFTARATQGGVRLEWDLSSSDGLGGFRILRSAGEAGDAAVDLAGRIAAGVRRYVDKTAWAGQRYGYILVATERDGSEVRSQSVSVTAAVPSFALHATNPNPFDQSTSIRYSLSKSGPVGLDVYDVAGRLVRQLVARRLRAGVYSESWDGRDSSGNLVASGVYFYRLTVGARTLTRKAVLLR